MRPQLLLSTSSYYFGNDPHLDISKKTNLLHAWTPKKNKSKLLYVPKSWTEQTPLKKNQKLMTRASLATPHVKKRIFFEKKKYNKILEYSTRTLEA